MPVTRSIALFACSLALQGLFPAWSSSAEVFLDCDGNRLTIDTVKETFSYSVGENVYKGKAEIFPGQINYAYEVSAPPGHASKRLSNAFRYAWVIDRQDLSYVRKFQTGHTLFRGSISWMGDGESVSGKCKIVPAPKRLI